MLSPQYRGMVPVIGKSINAKPATSPLANYGRFGTHGGRHGGRPGPVPDPWRPTLLSDNDYPRPFPCMSRTVRWVAQMHAKDTTALRLRYTLDVVYLLSVPGWRSQSLISTPKDPRSA
ncbi:hypothetical protein CH63R_01858 [Colletotrichum higginsianum IMI 349063]|uniref:Uncharacterized protein n=1 Tax=Colletotrichum higginsianum (strain IMI 349063) TaxID=759273 RepID=A0A1B7YMH3_COLHI|nr:hypothetical protein CH63R_01858 [Colletotrichum higginsianum IMI 349063]OBR13132.1 hypothetical protein CH63R_01858 [Colletotrichum higginsianum IMI 349063]